MKILLIHNSYQQPGGEDQVFDAERALLARYGHQVLTYTAHNRRISELGHLRLAGRTVWSMDCFRDVRHLLSVEKPDIVHVHNTFPLISPSVYYAARAEQVPIIQTLHNYRFQCLPGDFIRDGRICEDCLGRLIPWPGILHSCYRGSRRASAVVAGMLTTHRLLGTYNRIVDLYIALTDFGREKLVEGGLPAKKVVVKPNFVDPDPGVGEGEGGYALFVGRLSSNKGVRTLLAAWKEVGPEFPLFIVGDGDLAPEVVAAEKEGGIHLLGWRPKDCVMELMRKAEVLILPSECYEGFPLVVVEAMATGLPIIASNLGAMSKVLRHGETGLHFTPGDAFDLSRTVRWFRHHPGQAMSMRRAARKEYESHYTAETNYRLLIQAYERALREKVDKRSRMANGGDEPIDSGRI